MFRTFEETPDGLGVIRNRPEHDEEIRQYRAAYPPHPDGLAVESPCPIAGVVTFYQWTAEGHLLTGARKDPYWKPAAAPAVGPAPFRAIPSRETLLNKSIVDLITLAAEYRITKAPDESKAALVARLIPAMQQRNEELAKAEKAKNPALVGAGA